MGFDLTVTKGNVRLAEAHTLVRELLEFAAQMELEVIPVNWIVSGLVPDHCGLLRRILGKNADVAQPLVSRNVVKKTVKHGKGLLRYEINQEHVQGIVFYHHYEEWILTWNVTREGLLGRYCQITNAETEMLFARKEAAPAKSLLPTICDFINLPPIEVNGEFWEDHINIHCPWRRSDAAAACDVVKLLARHSDGLEARDDLGVWPDKDFTKWVNFANKYAELLGTAPLHPDPTDNL